VPYAGMGVPGPCTALGVQRALLVMKEAEDEYLRARELLDKGLISRSGFEKREFGYVLGRLNYLEHRLRAGIGTQNVLIRKATKYRSRNGDKRVKLTLKNVSQRWPLLGETLALVPAAEGQTGGDDLWDVFVSLSHNGSMISQPYEAYISHLPADGTASVDFGLLKDVEEVAVQLRYAGSSIEKRVRLQRSAGADAASITSLQYSQVADLGAEAKYDLTVESFGSEKAVFKLTAIGLPSTITYAFVENETEAKLSHVSFEENTRKKEVAIVLHMPDRPDSEVVIDRPIPFTVAAIDQGLAELPPEELSERLTGQPEDGLPGSVGLEVLPRGKGRMELVIGNLYYDIEDNAAVNTDMSLRNAGTGELHNVQLVLDGPYGWDLLAQPTRVGTLDPGDERRISLNLIPPPDVGGGDFEVRAKAQCLVAGQTVDSPEKFIRVHVRSKTNVVGAVMLIATLAAVSLGIVGFGVWLSRR